jgi:CcmD family protein
MSLQTSHSKREKRAFIVALLLAGLSFAPAVAMAQQQPPSSAAQEGFVPVDQVKGAEQIPAAPLVIAAYSVAWIAIFGYVWTIWQRQRKVEQEISATSPRRTSSSSPRFC